MERWDVINKLIEKNNFKSYLEIGLDNPDANFNKINCATKHSVDPFFETDHGELCDVPVSDFEHSLKFLTFRMTSDEFFKTSSMKYDIIFIDGLHTERQCGKDIINALKHLNEGGYVIVHDCLPESYEAQAVPRIQDVWNGDLWKCFPELNKQFIEYEVINHVYGLGIIKYTPDWEYLHYLDKSTYDWNDFLYNWYSLMHVITEDEFLEKYINN